MLVLKDDSERHSCANNIKYSHKITQGSIADNLRHKVECRHGRVQLTIYALASDLDI